MTDFASFWSTYPRKDNKRDAEKAWAQVIKFGHKPEEIIAGAKAYALYWKEKGTDRSFMPLPGSWLRGLRWKDECLAGRFESPALPLLAQVSPSWNGSEQRLVAQLGPNGQNLFNAYFRETEYREGVIYVPSQTKRTIILNRFEHKLFALDMRVEVKPA